MGLLLADVALLRDQLSPSRDNASGVSVVRRASAEPARGTALLLGDSLAEVLPPASAASAYPSTAGRLLGWRVITEARNDLGYVAGGGHPAILRAAARHAHLRPAVVVLAIGMADALRPSATTAAQSATSTTVHELRRLYPRAQLVLLAPIASADRPPEPVLRVRDALRATAGRARVPLIDPIADRWIDGDRLQWITGDSTPGAGNATELLAGDGRHLTTVGHAVVGLRLADRLRAVLR